MAKRISELDAASALTTGDELLVLQAGAAKRGEFSTTPNAGKAMAWSSSPSGTFTPTLTFGGASTGITYSVQYGKYTVVGNICFYSIRLILSSKGTDTGSASISLSGAPIPFGSTIFNCLSAYGDKLSSVDLQGYIHIIERAIKLVSSSTGTMVQLANAHFADNTDLMVSGHYFIA